MEITTRDYEFSYGRSPRGRGSWAFDFYGLDGQLNAEPWFARDSIGVTGLTYGEARKLAVKEARRLGARRINVLT